MVAGQGLGQRFGGDHAGLHRGVGALDLRHVEEAARIAQQQPAGEAEFGQRLHAALDQRPRAVGDAAATLELLAHVGMRLEALHLVERRQPGIAVVQANHKTVGDEVVAEMI